METYNYWGSENEPPSHLKTKKQLAAMGLSPVNPVGVIKCRSYDLYLYDPTDPTSVKPKRKPSEKQLEALAANREKQAQKRRYEEWRKEDGRIERDRVRAVRWAQDILKRDDWVILDTETTGLYDAEIVEIAIVNSKAEPILNTLVKPEIVIPEEAIAIHGITDEMVENAPTFPEVYPTILKVLEGKEVIIYNADFDISILKYCCQLHNLEIIKFKSHCLMGWYSQWYGDWSYYYKNYRLKALNGGHRSLSDCLAALNWLKKMAADSPTINYPEGIIPPP